MKLKSAAIMRNPRRAVRQAGLTLIEAAMVLAIGATVIAGVMYFFQQANTQQQINQTMNQLASLQQSVRSLYSGSPNYSGLTETVLIDAEAAPSSMVSSGNLQHAFNDNVDVTTSSAGTNLFDIQLDNVPKGACVEITTKDFGSSLNRVQIGGTTVGTPGNLPVSVADASSNCADGGSTIIYTFY